MKLKLLSSPPPPCRGPRFAIETIIRLALSFFIKSLCPFEHRCTGTQSPEGTKTPGAPKVGASLSLGPQGSSSLLPFKPDLTARTPGHLPGRSWALCAVSPVFRICHQDTDLVLRGALRLHTSHPPARSPLVQMPAMPGVPLGFGGRLFSQF